MGALNVGNSQLNGVTRGMETKAVLSNGSVSNTRLSKFALTQDEQNLVELREDFQNTKNKQGIIGKAWNGFKTALGVGLSANDTKQAIQNFQNGNISYEEAANTVKSFDEKQKAMTNTITNVATGLAVVASGVATGGLSIGALAAGAAIGGGTKAGIKMIDRTTNNIDGDATKGIAKDYASGAVDGTVTVLGGKMFKGLSNKLGVTKAGQSVFKSALKGSVAGGITGSVTGGISGGANYTIDNAGTKNFTQEGFIDATVGNARAGAITGGILGGIGGGVNQHKDNNIPVEKLEWDAILDKDGNVIVNRADMGTINTLGTSQNPNLGIGTDLNSASGVQIINNPKILGPTGNAKALPMGNQENMAIDNFNIFKRLASQKA